VFSGSVPPGLSDDVYAQWIRMASAAGARTVLDTAGPALAGGIAASPNLVKPNRLEVEEFLRMRIADERDLVAAGRWLLQHGAGTAVISLGADGALSAGPDGLWRATAPAVAAGRTVGAGDAMVAGLAYALERALPAVDALRLATALGSAAAASPSPLPRLAMVETLLSRIVIEPVETEGAASGLPGVGA
jgi:1-phosphofructokinase family hexose kinase